MAVLNDKFAEYYIKFEDVMTREAVQAEGEILAVSASAYQDMLSSIKDNFKEYGLTKEQETEFLMQAHVQAFAAVNSNAMKAALGLIAEEKDQDVKDSQIGMNSAQISKLLAETIFIQQQTQTEIEKTLTQIQITAKTVAETDLILQKELTEIEVTETQSQTTLKVIEEILKVTEDTARITRDITAYDDQMLMDSVKNQASVASFAVNSNSDFAQNALDDLKCLMHTVVLRADPTNTCLVVAQ